MSLNNREEALTQLADVMESFDIQFELTPVNTSDPDLPNGVDLWVCGVMVANLDSGDSIIDYDRIHSVYNTHDRL